MHNNWFNSRPCNVINKDRTCQGLLTWHEGQVVVGPPNSGMALHHFFPFSGVSTTADYKRVLFVQHDLRRFGTNGRGFGQIMCLGNLSRSMEGDETLTYINAQETAVVLTEFIISS